MMQEIAAFAGNFCGVCPVIGRLKASCVRLRISPQRGNKAGNASVFFHERGVIRTAARTAKRSTVPSEDNEKLSTFH